MSCISHFSGDTAIHRLDPRLRIVVTFVFAGIIALGQQLSVLTVELAMGCGLAMLARLPVAPLAKRLFRLNLFMLVLFAVVPFTTPGETLFTLGPLAYRLEGFLLSASITLKANAIILVFSALLNTVEPFALGHAFQGLRVPSKLIHLYFFTMRYLDVLHHEYLSLRRALKARAFHPRMNLHTYRAYAYLTAMVLVRSLERSERILTAMKCRGFHGRFYTLSRWEWTRGDHLFIVASLAVLILIALMEWGRRMIG